ncbi:hypothetical protein ACE6H2_006493 [Prunus campanulata]
MTFIKDIYERFKVKFKIWTEDGTCTSTFTWKHISTLAVKAIYLNELLETLYNGEEIDSGDGWFIVYCIGQARLVGDFLKIYEDSEEEKFSVPGGGLEEECN